MGLASHGACSSHELALWGKNVTTNIPALFAEQFQVRELEADRKALAHRELITGQLSETVTRSDVELLQEHSLFCETGRDMFYEE